jgi:hypothetical protein
MKARSVKTSWTGIGRLLVFLLASSSISCLLLDFYSICPMRVFAPFVFLPAMLVLLVWAVLDRSFADGRLGRAVFIGIAAGLAAAVAYDIFRLPFVFAKTWGIASVVPAMNLFKVFSAFGAMILGQPIEQESHTRAALFLGWVYHFSNGATFGVMYMAMIGDGMRRHWAWGVVMAVALELGMLLTPYPKVFGIPVTPRFVVVTMAAHGIFGIMMGLGARWLAQKSEERSAQVAVGTV